MIRAKNQMSPLVHTTTLHTGHPHLFPDHLNQHVLFAFLLGNAFIALWAKCARLGNRIG